MIRSIIHYWIANAELIWMDHDRAYSLPEPRPDVCASVRGWLRGRTRTPVRARGGPEIMGNPSRHRTEFGPKPKISGKNQNRIRYGVDSDVPTWFLIGAM